MAEQKRATPTQAAPSIDAIELAAEAGLTPPAIQVDGGIDPTSAPVAAAAGASVFVGGSSVFRWPAGIAANFAALESSIAVHV